MALSSRLAQAARALMGMSGYDDAKPVMGPELNDPDVEKMRQALGGQLTPISHTRPRWYLADLETAQATADGGNVQLACQLWRASKRDGLIGGLRKTLSAGLVGLPKRFRGSDKIVADLTATNGTRSLFDEIFPPAELAKLADDGVGPGVGVAVLQDVPGREHPVMCRLNPEFLNYRWSEDRWYYQSTVGNLAVTPGINGWIFHSPGGRYEPWNNGEWQPIGNAFITREHAKLHRANYSAKLANPARVAKAALGATEGQRLGFLDKLIAWGINSVFELPPGWDVALLESNGRGWEVFGKEYEDAGVEVMITLAGQVVTVTGGSGFANADIHRTIRSDLIKLRADELAFTINTQGIPQWEIPKYGIDALDETARVEWDTAPPKDRKTEAESLGAVGKAIVEVRTALKDAGKDLDVAEVTNRFGIPVVDAELPAKEEPKEEPEEASKEEPPTASPSPEEAA